MCVFSRPRSMPPTVVRIVHKWLMCVCSEDALLPLSTFPEERVASSVVILARHRGL
jgi:hypothetical protein